jgi:homoserine kinase
VAACLHGGAVVAFESASGWRAAAFRPHPELRPVVLVPEHARLATEEARRALPRQVPLADAAFNVGRAALAVLALTERPDLLGQALDDRLHQPHRLPLMPATRVLFDELRAGSIPVCVAGAGPSLLAFEDDAHPVPDPGEGWRVLRLQTAPRGAEVRKED